MDRRKRQVIYDFIKKTGANITCLQETHSTLQTEDIAGQKNGWENPFGTHKTTSPRGPQSCRHKIQEKPPNHERHERHGRSIQLRQQAGETKLDITSYYGHNNRPKRRMQLRQLATRVRGIKHQNNSARLQRRGLDRQPVDTRREEAQRSANAMNTMGVEDTFRKIHGNRKEYTFFYKTGKSRLD